MEKYINNNLVIYCKLVNETIVIREGKIGDKFNKYKLNIPYDSFLKELHTKGFKKLNGTERIQYRIFLCPEVETEEEQLMIFLKRDSVEDSIEAAIGDRFLADYVGSSDFEMVYNVWDDRNVITLFKAIVKQSVEKNGIKNYILVPPH